MGFVYLGLAIVLELLGTTFLKYTLGFTKLSPSLVVVAAYTGAFYFLFRFGPSAGIEETIVFECKFYTIFFVDALSEFVLIPIFVFLPVR